MTATNMKLQRNSIIQQSLNNCLVETNFDFAKKITGKVRDIYDLGDRMLLVTTDRQSAFDRLLASVPFKGSVLNLTSAWWFQQTRHVVPNHLLAVPDPNVMLVKKCEVFPIEFVVRAYITGTTSTSLWTQYNNGVRQYCGIQFPDGLIKNQKLEKPVLTPTTKDKEHDKPISPEEIVSEGWMTANDWQQASEAALKLFNYSADVANKHGLILVDTKYEFGRDDEGNIVVVDEINTPDSSRYWLADSYQSRIAEGKEPENIDKEFLRLWFKEHCDPYNDDTLPQAPDELIIKLASRYIQLYEMITDQLFDLNAPQAPIESRILANIQQYL